MTERVKTYEDISPSLAIPPGETLLDELRARGMTQIELAKRMGRPPKVVSQIINGKKAITAETAIQLEKVIDGVGALFWLRLEAQYRLTLARQQARATA